METEATVTPIDRPLMRSDLNEIRQIVWNISERQMHENRKIHVMTWVCVSSTLVSAACMVISLLAMGHR